MSELQKFIMLKNVRCSFPHLFERPMIKGEEAKCGINVLLNPQEPAHAAQLKLLASQIELLIQTQGKGARIPADKRCLRKGSESTRPEYDGFWTVSTNHKTKPVVLSGDGQSVITTQEQCPIYSGCRVNVKIQLWFQNNKYGKRINATPIAVQFAGDDEPLDGTYVPIEQAMEGFDGFNDGVDDFGQPTGAAANQVAETDDSYDFL